MVCLKTSIIPVNLQMGEWGQVVEGVAPTEEEEKEQGKEEGNERGRSGGGVERAQRCRRGQVAQP